MTDTTQAPAAAPVTTDMIDQRLTALEANLTAHMQALEDRLMPAPAAADASTWKRLGVTVVTDAVKGAWNVLSGFKTVIFFGLSGAVALADAFGAFDFTPFVQWFLPAGTTLQPGIVVALMSAAGIILRTVTNGPLFKSIAKDVTGA